ncbi:uncharacterized protein LOC144345112 [Saccoglossus kowalevskii]
MENIKAPDKLDVNANNLALVWKRWKEELTLYTELVLTETQENKKCKLFLYLIGKEGREIYETMKFEKEEKDLKLEDLIKAFDDHCNPKKNETVERYKFFTRNQEPHEGLDKYITDLKVLAATCNFSTLHDSLIRDRLVCGIGDTRLRERLLRETDLDLDKCLQICRASELSKERIRTIEAPVVVHAVRQSHDKAQKSYKKTSSVSLQSCKYCGKKHDHDKNKCPAYRKQCYNCKRMNHFASQCM